MAMLMSRCVTHLETILWSSVLIVYSKLLIVFLIQKKRCLSSMN